VNAADAPAWIGSAAVLLLAAAYGLGAPAVLARSLYTLTRRRRSRYRAGYDEILSTSRFTIPVSVIIPASGATPTLVAAVTSALALHYPEFEVIVVTEDRGAIESLRPDFDLRPCEVFFRRSLTTAAVRTIHRSTVEPRLLVAEVPESSNGDLRNCGINLARFRYVCVGSPYVRYEPQALLECMHVALEDPGRVIGVTASVSETAGGAATGPGAHLRPADALRFAAATRRRLSGIGRRRLDLPPEGPVAWGIWRRDTLLAVGGFSTDESSVDADLTFRFHQHFAGDRERYSIVHVAEPAGRLIPGAADNTAWSWARPPLALVLRHAAPLFKPAFGRLGLFDLPRFLFSTYATPWLEASAFVVALAAVMAGAVAPGHFLLMLFIVGLGNGMLVSSALLLDAEHLRRFRPASVFNLILVSPLAHKAAAQALR
jgi:hypothetical protein